MEWLVKVLQINGCTAEEITAVATMFLAILALATLIAVFWVGRGQLIAIRREEHNEIIKNLIETWESDSTLKSRKIFADVIRGKEAITEKVADSEQLNQESKNLKETLEQLEARREPAFYDLMRIPNHMETVAYMMQSKQDKNKISDLMGDAVIYYFERYKAWITNNRKLTPRIFEYFESLYEYCKKHSE